MREASAPQAREIETTRTASSRYSMCRSAEKSRPGRIPTALSGGRSLQDRVTCAMVCWRRTQAAAGSRTLVSTGRGNTRGRCPLRGLGRFRPPMTCFSASDPVSSTRGRVQWQEQTTAGLAPAVPGVSIEEFQERHDALFFVTRERGAISRLFYERANLGLTPAYWPAGRAPQPRRGRWPRSRCRPGST